MRMSSSIIFIPSFPSYSLLTGFVLPVFEGACNCGSASSTCFCVLLIFLVVVLNLL